MSTTELVPTEEEEQIALICWAGIAVATIPELALLYAIPNGGHRNKATAGRLKACGVKAGVPDLHLPVARGIYHSLYIELKRRKGGSVSPEQRRWIRSLAGQGHCACVCAGWDAARDAILNYLQLPTAVSQERAA